MATPPTTLIPPGAGGPILNDYCECVCGIPPVTLLTSTRSASAEGPQSNGQTPYSAAQTALADAAYSGYGDQGSSDFAQVLAAVQLQGSDNVTTYNPDPPVGGQSYTQTEVQTTSYNTSTELLAVSLTEGTYKLRVQFAQPWQGSSGITVSWRERTTNYTGSSSQTTTTTYPEDYPTTPPSIEAGPTEYSEQANFSYVAQSETLTPTPGAMSVDTAEYDLPNAGLNLGDSVNITGPADLATFFARQTLPLNGAPYAPPNNSCGINVQALAESASKYGFLSYIRPAVASAPVDIYATETASVAKGFPDASYSGSQSFDQYGQFGVQYDPVDPENPSAPPVSSYQNTFSANVPAALQAPSQYTGPVNTSVLPSQVVSRTPTVAQYNRPAGLVMTLTDPITTGALTAFVDALVAAALAPPAGSSTPTPMPADSTDVLALRLLPPDELSYSVKQATQQGFLNITVDGGIISPLSGAVLAPVSTSLSVSVDLLTTDLDTGESQDSKLTFNFAVDNTSLTTAPAYGASSLDNFTLTASEVVPVPIPSTNQRITWSNPQVTGPASLDRWAIYPQAQVIDTATT